MHIHSHAAGLCLPAWYRQSGCSPLCSCSHIPHSLHKSIRILNVGTNDGLKIEKKNITMASQLVLLDLLPRAGFCWPQEQGWPLVLRTRGRDGAVLHVLGEIVGDEGLRKRTVRPILVAAMADLADLVGDPVLGVAAEASLLVWLGKRRATGFSALASAISENMW